MSSFYGNIKNSNQLSLIFDRIYPNRRAMEANCSTDGVFNNRFVLIDYGEKEISPYTRVFISKDEFELDKTKYYYIPIGVDLDDNISLESVVKKMRKKSRV